MTKRYIIRHESAAEGVRYVAVLDRYLPPRWTQVQAQAKSWATRKGARDNQDRFNLPLDCEIVPVEREF